MSAVVTDAMIEAGVDAFFREYDGGADGLDNIRATVAAVLRAADDARWQPIETAPKEHWVLGLYPGDAWAPVWTVRQGEFDGRYGDHHSSDTATEKPEPTRWMPLPELPDAKD